MMCCGKNSYRTPSLFVGWINVAFSILAVMYYTYLLATFAMKTVETVESAETEELVESDFQAMFESAVVYNNITFLAASLLLWFVPSVLLIKGIKQNRHILLTPWLFMAYVSIAVNCIFLYQIILFLTSYTEHIGMSLLSCLPLSFGLIFSILCLHPVRKLYKNMSMPPSILPTQCVVATKEPEDHKRYMPVFDN